VLPAALPPTEGAPAVLPGEVIPAKPPGGEATGGETGRSR
jgi:hypothetical protein